MKILLLIRSLDIGGSERQLIVLARELHRRQHEVTVATLYGGGELEAELRDAGVRVIALSKRSRWDIVAFTRRLLQHVVQLHPDVLYTFLPSQNLIGAVVHLRNPWLKLVWGVRASNIDLRRYDFVTALTYRLQRLFVGAPAMVISNSHAGAAYAVEHGFPKEKMFIVANGIDCDQFRRDDEERVRLRSSWGVGDEKIVGLVARLDPMKDHPTFLRAAAALLKTHPAVRFVCVGAGSEHYRGELIAIAQELNLEDRVRWMAPLHNPLSIYNAIDVMVLSSAYGEGFPNVVGEAMACGTPCVVTDVGDAARIVGDMGPVVRPRDVAGLAASMARVLDDPPLANDLRQRIVEKFSIHRLATETEGLLATMRENATKDMTIQRREG